MINQPCPPDGVWSGKVVIVTKRSVRSLNLTDGNSGWRAIATGLPSGQGVASDNVYYVPVKDSTQHHEPGIAAIDVAKGVLIGTTRMRGNRPICIAEFDIE